MGQKIVFVRNKGFVSIQLPVLLLMLQQIMSLKLCRMQYSVIFISVVCSTCCTRIILFCLWYLYAVLSIMYTLVQCLGFSI